SVRVRPPLLRTGRGSSLGPFAFFFFAPRRALSVRRSPRQTVIICWVVASNWVAGPGVNRDVPAWRNWQTLQLVKLLSASSVRVRVPPPARLPTGRCLTRGGALGKFVVT